jgi:hypothetical protein
VGVTSHPERGRGRVTDPLVVGAAAFAVLALHGYSAPLGRDLGVFTYGGLRVLDGIPPYTGIFNSVGPLGDMVPALGIWLGRLVGVGTVLSERLLFAVLTAACCALIHALARDVFNSRAAAFVAPATLLTYRVFLDLGSDGPREKTTMALFLVATLVLVGRRRWIAAGACTALATLAWQPALLPACVAALTAIVALGARRPRAAAQFVLGGAVPSGILVAYFLERRGLSAAFEGFLLINLDYTRQPSLLTAPHEIIATLRHGYGASLWLVVAGLVALVVPAVVALVRGPADSDVVPVAAGGLAATTWTVAVINGAPDLFVVLPFAAIGTAGVVAAAVSRLQPRHGRLLAGAVTAAALVAASLSAVSTRKDRLDEQRADVSAVLAAAPPGATLISLNAPQVLALADRRNPSRYQYFDEPQDQYIAHTYPGGLDGYAAWVSGRHATLVAVGATNAPGWAVPMLHRDYVEVGRAPGWTWYLARFAGPAAAARVSAASRSAVAEAHRSPPPAREPLTPSVSLRRD